jgi:hypothetical protein
MNRAGKDDEKILTKHPSGKHGINITKKYDTTCKAILDSLVKKEMSYPNIVQAVGDDLRNSFESSIKWYVKVIQFDLEIRNMIEKIPITKPQMYRLR